MGWSVRQACYDTENHLLKCTRISNHTDHTDSPSSLSATRIHAYIQSKGNKRTLVVNGVAQTEDPEDARQQGRRRGVLAVEESRLDATGGGGSGALRQLGVKVDQGTESRTRARRLYETCVVSKTAGTNAGRNGSSRGGMGRRFSGGRGHRADDE